MILYPILNNISVWNFAHAQQWQCTGIKLNSRVAFSKTLWHNQKAALFKRARSRLFSAFAPPSGLLWSFRKSSLNFVSYPYSVLYKAATRHYGTGVWNSKLLNPDCRPEDFKQTYIMPQVSAGAKSECKITARVSFCGFSKEIGRAGNY